jgi:BirA family biotin operon repressor/biotin-[acetyl-CoA-carboxylase] ligase
MDSARELLESSVKLDAPGAVKAIVLAGEQLAGRGQRGRTWESPGLGNLYATVLITWPQLNTSTASMVALLAGSAAADSICEAHLRRGGSHEVLKHLGVKWPNDVIINDRKVGGLLTELHTRNDGTCFAAIGLGINLTSPPLNSAVAERSTCLLSEHFLYTPATEQILWFARSFNRLARQFNLYGEESVLRSWRRWDVTTGRSYTTITEQGTIQGIANGLGPHGELSLILADGITVLVTSASSLSED